MKREILIAGILIVFAANMFAVFHKIGHYPVDTAFTGGEITGDLLYVLDIEAFKVLDISIPETPQLILSYPLNFEPADICIENAIAYIGGGGRIEIYDIFIPETPVLLSSLVIDYWFESINIENNILYAACCQDEVHFIDVSDPHQPVFVGSFNDLLCPVMIDVKWPAAYVQNFEGALYIVNVEDLSNPVIVEQIPSLTDYFLIDGDQLYANTENNSLAIYDITQPLSPILISSAPNVGRPLYIENDLIYTAYTQIDIFQISNNFELTPVGFFDSRWIIEDFIVVDGIAFDINRWNGLQVIDMSDPIEDQCLGSCETPDSPLDLIKYGNAVYLSFDYNELPGLVDVTNWEEPAFSQFPGLEYSVDGLALWNNFLYANSFGQINIFDVSYPLLPELRNTYSENTGSTILTTLDDILVELDYHGVFFRQIENGLSIPGISQFNSINYKTSVVAKDNLVCFEAYNIGVFFLDLSDPFEPQQTAFYPLDGEVMGMTLNQQVLYISSENGLLIIDVSNPASPELLSTIQPHNDSDFRAPAIVDGNDLILADAAWNEISVYDISNPSLPVLQSNYYGCRQIWEMTLVDNKLFTANFRSGFAIMNLEGMLAVDENIITPNDNNLSNYPNPFNPTTTISFELFTENVSKAAIEIYNLKGQKIRTFTNLQINQSPNQQILWNGNDDLGKPVCSGIYFIRLSAANKTQAVKKCLLLK
ncbi:MAG: T9SS type A sorting domain-containing protein [Candidatus Cloacimonadales bacterium]|nr:T9SS type A sorting domain-containing protein [Candidatus Cloacimonadales bacterium]